MDDIDYLLKNSEKDSSLIIIDSSLRDRYKYPQPSEYVVEFDQPFRFVYGFDIIDATIPSTMYGIDTHNNILFFVVFSSINMNKIDNNNKLQVYDMFYEKLETSQKFVDLYKKQRRSKVVFMFCSEYPKNVVIVEDTFDDCYLVVGEEVIQVQQFTLNELLMFGDEYDFVVDSCIYEIEKGNYNILTLQTYLKKELRLLGIDVRSASIEQRIDKHMKFKFVHFDPTSGISNPFFFDMERSTATDVLGFDELPDPRESVMYLKKDVCTFAACKDVSEQVYSIEPPGVVNLLGVRYIVLRCPEIENHLLSFGNNDTGLGIFKLQSPYEISNLKFDFFNFVKKPFHPIGKLTKLSIRFERKPNVLYNFRGVNHHILLTLKYYVPSMKGELDTVRILNPNYNPNILQYMVERNEILNDDEDDDDEYDNMNDKELLSNYVYMKNNIH